MDDDKEEKGLLQSDYEVECRARIVVGREVGGMEGGSVCFGEKRWEEKLIESWWGRRLVC